MGCGKNGTFDIHPDWRQWALLCTVDEENIVVYNIASAIKKLPSFIIRYWKFFRCHKRVHVLSPIEGHGKWDGKDCFGNLPKQSNYDGQIAILTRATIRLKSLKSFWSNVDAVAQSMKHANGLVYSIGIGEVPFIKQATFSIWRSKEDMKAFAYTMKEHTQVMQRTRKEDWYKEEMFVRFKILFLG